MEKQIKLLAYIYSVRVYTALISILLIPYIIKLVGYESYGLIGFYAVLFACLNILDAGIGGVLTRQSILSRTSKQDYRNFISVFNKVIKFFVIVGLITALTGTFLAYQYSKTWLNTNLSNQEVAFCISLMFCIFAVRYIQGPYKSLLLSNDSQIAITTINFIYVTLSQPVTLLVLIYFQQGIKFYFIEQLIAATISALLMIFYGERTKKKILEKLQEVGDIAIRYSFKSMILFALQLSILTILWIMVNQSDKLALTQFMQLEDYAKYSVAVSAAALIFIISDPLNQVLLPRLTRSISEKKYVTYTKYFLSAFCFVCVCLIPITVFFFFYSSKLIYVWSGNIDLAMGGGKYLPWLFLGGVFGVFSNFCFLLRYSNGSLKNHTLVYFIFSLIVVPLNIVIARQYLGVGTSLFFTVSSGILFLGWGVYNLNRYFVGGGNLVIKLMLPLFFLMFVYFYSISSALTLPVDRLLCFLMMFAIGLGGTALSGVYVLLFRKKIEIKFREALM